jgi:sugar phosphate isomerase/epimerase
VQGLEEIVRFAEPYGIQIRLENHYRDKSVWELPDFTHKAEVFFQLYDRIQDTPVMINYDCSNPLMCGDDPLEILHKVKKKVVSVHASDRKRGSYQHSVIGEGEVPFDDIFQVLSESGFTGWISAEDGNPKGDEGFFKSLEFLRAKLDEYWPS